MPKYDLLVLSGYFGLTHPVLHCVFSFIEAPPTFGCAKHLDIEFSLYCCGVVSQTNSKRSLYLKQVGSHEDCSLGYFSMRRLFVSFSGWEGHTGVGVNGGLCFCVMFPYRQHLFHLIFIKILWIGLSLLSVLYFLPLYQVKPLCVRAFSELGHVVPVYLVSFSKTSANVTSIQFIYSHFNINSSSYNKYIFLLWSAPLEAN